jgi:hypothetical protein
MGVGDRAKVWRAFDDVDELVHAGIFAKQDVSIVDAVPGGVKSARAGKWERNNEIVHVKTLQCPKEIFAFEKLAMHRNTNALLADCLDHGLVALGERHCSVELDAAAGSFSERYVWRLSVDPDTACLQLFFEQRALDFVLRRVEDLQLSDSGNERCRPIALRNMAGHAPSRCNRKTLRQQ